jgi:exopolysaccharide production protein ExoY
MYQSFLKPLLDLSLAMILLIILLPLIIIISLGIALTSRGKIVLAQPRMGLGGIPFDCLKFRTMYEGNSKRFVKEVDENGTLHKIENDPRVTPIGFLLRKFSLDELPQLINVLRGEMSLVGPRPLIPSMVQPYPSENALRTKIRPGITGLWQIKARSESSSVLQMIVYDREYIANSSLTTDLKILALTVPAVLTGRGAK